jgi:hypothetical protein
MMKSKAAIEASIQQQCRIAKRDGQLGALDALDCLAGGLLFVNIPAALALGAVGLGAQALANRQNLSSHPMPDQWLKEVAQWDGMSAKGLAFLSNKVAKQGFVTAQDALDWIQIEERISDRLHKKLTHERNLHSQGAVAILERAKNECPSLIDLPAIGARLQNLLPLQAAQDGIRAAGGKMGNAVTSRLRKFF